MTDNCKLKSILAATTAQVEQYDPAEPLAADPIAPIPLPDPKKERAEAYLRRREAAQYLRDRGIPRTEKTLAKEAVVGGGPVFRKFGKIVLYAPADLDQYVAAKLSKPVRSTSEY
jgi:hypothetical protein